MPTVDVFLIAAMYKNYKGMGYRVDGLENIKIAVVGLGYVDQLLEVLH